MKIRIISITFVIIICLNVFSISSFSESKPEVKAAIDDIFSIDVEVTDQMVSDYFRQAGGYFETYGDRTMVYFTKPYCGISCDSAGIALLNSEPEAFYNAVGFKYKKGGLYQYTTLESVNNIYYNVNIMQGSELDGYMWEYATTYDYIYLYAKIYYTVLEASKNSSFAFSPSHDFIMSGEASGYTEEIFLNDINFDGTVAVKDLICLKRFVAGSETGINFAAADQNGDGAISVKDLMLFKRVLASSEA